MYDWVDERLGLSELAAFARHKTVPVHSQSFWYYWGGISLFLFIVQCFTGVLLLVYALYRRDPVFIAGQALGLVVYVRNLYFIIVNGRQASAGD